MINTEKYYTPSEIAEQDLFPWITNERVILNWIKAQIEIGNKDKYNIVMKPGIDGLSSKFGNRYFVKGEGIIKIKAAFEDGSLFS